MNRSIERAPSFTGGERFVILRKLGSGGMGVVYEAFDRQRGAKVALKTLREVDAARLYHFKHEFRALADLSHPNLVGLYELVSIGQEWFFTMELVPGTDFLSYVRSPAERASTALEGESVTAPATPGRRPPAARAPVECGSSLSVPRLRATLPQLARGVAALHEAGKLHRDIKPSNILCTAEGRVVLCDFGLVVDLAEEEAEELDETRAVGTPAYMSPEQSAGLALSQGSDWYSVGIVLYQALTGQLPFPGDSREMMVAKSLGTPRPPWELSKDLPDELAQLCLELLRPRAEERPGGREILARLGVKVEAAPSALSTAPPTRTAPFLGRESHLELLRLAFEESQRGGPVVVAVHGSSGMGKTALARRFVEELRERDEALVLRGRCYERESVPYKALDSLMDELSAHLMRLSRRQAETLMPRDVPALARLFPVLRRVAAVAEPPVRGFEASDPIELRRRAVAALREMLAGLAQRRPLVVWLDDLQWGDVESATLLADLLRLPGAPPMLLLACYRREDEATSPFLREFRASADLTDLDVRCLAIEALSPAQARDLVLALARHHDWQTVDAERVAAESGGSPFFVHELVRHLRRHREASGRIRLDEVLRARIEQLPAEARTLLTAIALAGRPVAQSVLAYATALGERQPAALAILRAERLIRTGGARNGDVVETYHDRIREAVAADLARADSRRTHLLLAQALQMAGEPDPEALLEHFQEAGEAARAARFAVLAARQAGEALAFDRAARLYRLALELSPKGDDEARALRTALADALANAGRGAEAAAVYLQARAGARAAEALELGRRAAEQLLRCGHFEDGLAVMRDVLGAVGLRLASTPRRALASLVWGRVRVRLRGLRFRERDPSQVTEEALRRIDICWSVAIGLGMSDHMRGADFQARQLVLALRAGEPYRVARAMALEAGYLAGAGAHARDRSTRLLEHAEALAARVEAPHAQAFVTGAGGIAAFLQGRWREGQLQCDRAAEIFRERCTNVAWETASVQFIAIASLFFMGELGELARRVPVLIREAEERGDLYAVTNLRTGNPNFLWLARDDAARARQEAEEAIARWSHDGFHIQHHYDLLAQGQIDLYTGDLEAAQRRLEDGWPRLARSLLLRVQTIRGCMLGLRGRVALAQAVARPAARARWLRRAARLARQLSVETAPWCVALSRLLMAGITHARGEVDRAAALYADASLACNAAAIHLPAVVARRRQGELTFGERGAALVGEADAWMAGQGIRNPARVTALLAP